MFPAKFFFVKSSNILSIRVFEVAVILVGVLMVGYSEDVYIVPIRSVVSLSESQLKTLYWSQPLGFFFFFSWESFSRNGLIKSLVNSATVSFGCL